MATGYEDIDNLTREQNNMLDESLQKQEDIVNKQTQMNIDALERNKTEIDEQTKKTNQGLYTEYKKASNPYGVNAEASYARGLGNSGYAETTQTNLYNTYQKNVTNTINNAQKLKSDFDFQISQARQNGDITLAQNALQIYMQKMELLTQEYELRNNREQYLYQKEQDAQQQSNWEKEYAYQQQRDSVADQQWQQTFDYQKQRDAVADQQWARQYALSKKKSSSGGSGGGNVLKVEDNNGEPQPTLSASGEEIYKSAQGIYNSEIAKRGETKGKSREEYVISYLRNLYGTKQLSETDMRIIIDKMGLE